jgi:hypothetical protein
MDSFALHVDKLAASNTKKRLMIFSWSRSQTTKQQNRSEKRTTASTTDTKSTCETNGKRLDLTERTTEVRRQFQVHTDESRCAKPTPSIYNGDADRLQKYFTRQHYVNH